MVFVALRPKCRRQQVTQPKGSCSYFCKSRQSRTAEDSRSQGTCRHRGGELVDVADRNQAEALKGARIFVPRSSFPTAGTDEYYWVDLLGLDVVNREGVALGQVKDLMSTGPQTVLVLALASDEAGKPAVERMIPFVAAFVDNVDLPGRLITVDWQLDY